MLLDSTIPRFNLPLTDNASNGDAEGARDERRRGNETNDGTGNPGELQHRIYGKRLLLPKGDC